MGRKAGMRRFQLLFLAVLLIAPAWARAADGRVELKNADALSVSVPLGTANGVSGESDFAVRTSDNGTVLLYPVELYEKMFWSRTLSPEEFSRIAPGDPVRPVTLSKEEHAALRRAGEAEKAALKHRREVARREAARKEADDLRARLERLQSRRDDLSDRIADAEKTLADEEGRLDWLSSSEERGIDRALRNIQDSADRRDELQEQRNALSGQRPYPSAEANRLSAEIKRLNDRISSERDTIRAARDRKRSARSAYVSREQEWRKLVADRSRVSDEMKSIERKIRELEERH
jgi:predicted  nucleic acid-binding Zn-ribbon protein